MYWRTSLVAALIPWQIYQAYTSTSCLNKFCFITSMMAFCEYLVCDTFDASPLYYSQKMHTWSFNMQLPHFVAYFMTHYIEPLLLHISDIVWSHSLITVIKRAAQRDASALLYGFLKSSHLLPFLLDLAVSIFWSHQNQWCFISGRCSRPAARIFRRGVTWMSKFAWAYKTRGVWGHTPSGNF